MKGRFAVLLAPVVPRVDFDPIVSRATGCRHLRYEARQIWSRQSAF
jgi:hypothetical protein